MVRAKKRQKRTAAIPYYLLFSGLALVIIGVLMWLGGQSTSGTAAMGPAEIGQPAPPFELASLSGEKVSLEDYQGKVVVVNFWATWCPPCRAEMPGIQQVYAQYREQGVVVLAVNAHEERSLVNEFVFSNGLTFPVLLDAQSIAGNQYQASGLPTTVIIDRDGTITHMQSGPLTAEQLEALILPHL